MTNVFSWQNSIISAGLRFSKYTSGLPRYPRLFQPERSHIFVFIYVNLVEKEMAALSSVLAFRIPDMESMVGCHLWGHTESDMTEAIQQQQQHVNLGSWLIFVSKIGSVATKYLKITVSSSTALEMNPLLEICCWSHRQIIAMCESDGVRLSRNELLILAGPLK